MSKEARILDTSDLAQRIGEWRAEGRKVVMTSGVFDLVHSGHISTLEAAAGLGDKLIVALNSDASVQRKKGPKRPINDAVERAAHMAALRCVDAVVIFDEAGEQPIELVKALRPEIYVKCGREWPSEAKSALQAAVEDYGGQWKTVEHLEGRSTSALIRLIKERYSD